ncbi:Zinc finger MYND domain-containing 1 [Hyphodiscus hymeniophilus]|uniref:Zinc finger MYND domain-containing 1 n=1 Tax=Hyphodiscus hymeniophilus TaxID=353542 RepID=A0A9P6SK80_9HELO|nr:Zinc finger MYND domain-containing 1 [Hyphodiscus hymeniophilus]
MNSINRKQQYRRAGNVPKSIDRSPPHSNRLTWLASVTRHTPSANQSPDSSFSSSDSSSSSISPSSSSSSISIPATSPPSFFNEHLAILPSPKGGLGAFAIRDIPAYTTIIAEKPLFKVYSFEEVPWRYDDLSKEQKKAYDSLHYWVRIDKDRVFGIFKTNRFELKGSSGIFSTCSRFNHACHPHSTCTYSWDMEEQRMKVSTLRDIVAGTELTISYMGYSVNRKLLKQNYGFDCDCSSCVE